MMVIGVFNTPDLSKKLHEERDEPSYWKGLGEQRDGEDGATALRRLLLTKQLVELALNYGRYRAKGMD